MTLILKHDLGMVKIDIPLYIPKMKSLCEGFQKTDKHIDRQTDTTENITYPHSRVVTNEKLILPHFFHAKGQGLC